MLPLENIKNELFAGGKAEKLIELGNKVKNINFNFIKGKDTASLSLQVSEIILILKFFASAKDENRMENLMNIVSENKEKKKLVEKMKVLAGDGYTLEEVDKDYLKKVLDEKVIDDFLKEMAKLGK